MEASENAGLPLEGRGGTGGLQRIDLRRVSETLSSVEGTAGLSRLELMINTIVPRLVGDAPDPKAR
jgi:hypothetical protein